MADMHERKSVMAKHADAFIALPGEFPPISFTKQTKDLFSRQLERLCVRWVWNHGGAVGDDNMVSAWDT